MSRDRKLAALRAMAEQTASPEEAAIARRKLARYESFTEVLRTIEEWEALRAEQDAEAERQRAADVRADVLRRFERGGFTGVTIRAGATLSATHGKPR